MGAFGVTLLPGPVRESLQHGEVALAYENASMMSAAEGDAKGSKPRLAEGFSWDPINGGIQPGQDYFESKLSGIGVEGGAGAIASLIAAAISEGAHLLLTNQRLIVVDSVSHRFRESVGRGHLIQIEGNPRFGQFGRIAATFGDGSVARPILGLLSKRTANRFLRAWHTGQPQS